MSGGAPGWLAGAASVAFPVAVGTPLAGYAARSGPSVGTLDDVAIGALVLERAGARLAIVAADVVAVDAALAGEVAAAAGLGRSELLLAASHTHAGPAGIVPRLHPADPDRLDRGLRARFVAAAGATIADARRRLAPVDLVVGAADAAGVCANRNDPAGSCDPRLTVLATRRRDGATQAVVVHFACHPTVLGADNPLASADFPGALRRSVADALAPGGAAPAVLFVNGAAGDVSTRFTRRGQDAGEVERVGRALAAVAIAALDAAAPAAGPLRHGSVAVRLPRRQAGADPVRADATAPPGGHAAVAANRRIAETRAQGAAMLAALEADPDAPVPDRLVLDGWTVGGATLVAVPGELFAALAPAAGDPRAPVLVVGYANGYAGYLADRAAYAAGTYEALASPFAPGTGERVAAAIGELVARLRAGCAPGRG